MKSAYKWSYFSDALHTHRQDRFTDTDGKYEAKLKKYKYKLKSNK